MNEVKPEEIKQKIKKSKSMNLPEIKIEKDIDEYIKKFNKEEELAKYDKLYNQIKDKEKKKINKKEKIKQEEIKPKKEINPIIKEWDQYTINYIINQYDEKLDNNL
jgi:hypothetical protein